MRCSCMRVNYCDDACLRAGRADHRLTCPASKPTSNEMKPGAIVRISGLQSEKGKPMNNHCAEIMEIQEKTGRIGVVLTLDRKIKVASIKPENLTLELSVLAAVKKSVSVELEKTFTQLVQDEMDVVGAPAPMVGLIYSLNPEEIVRRVRGKDSDVLRALDTWSMSLDGSDYSRIVSFHKHGLAGALLDTYTFPEAIDMTTDADAVRMHAGPQILANQLVQATEFRLEVVRMIGPAILTCASKKHRLASRTDRWWFAQKGFVNLVHNCLSASVPEHQAARALKQELAPIVAEKLAEYTIECMTVDHALFLDYSPHRRTKGLEVFSPEVRTVSIANLREIANVSIFGKAFVSRIGEMIVPAGAPGLTGRRFAECFLDCAAHLALVEGPEDFGVDKLATLRCILANFHICDRLHPLLGESPNEFFYELGGLRDFKEWAKARLGTSG